MYVIKVMSGDEEKVKNLLTQKGYKILCPKKIKIHRRKDSYYEKEMVIFTGYLFLELETVTDRQYYQIKTIDGVIGFLSASYALYKQEQSYIRVLDNNGEPIREVVLYFDKYGFAHLTRGFIDGFDKQIVSVNRKDKTVAIEFKIENDVKKIVLNYTECLGRI